MLIIPKSIMSTIGETKLIKHSIGPWSEQCRGKVVILLSSTADKCESMYTSRVVHILVHMP